MSPPSGPPNTAGIAAKPAFKRHKVRKGTFSCWECKTRKIKCDILLVSGSVCSSCQRRGAQCVSQELVEVGEKQYQHVETRVEQLENLISQLAQEQCSSSPTKRGTMSNCTQSLMDAVQLVDHVKRSFSPSVSSIGQQALNQSCSLSAYLHSLLPSRRTTITILQQCKYFQLPYHLIRKKHESLRYLKPTTENLNQVSIHPPPSAPPLAFAHRLIQIALCLQQLDNIDSSKIQFRLSGSATDAACRLVNLASQHVTTKDELMRSLEGIEILMLEGGFYVTIGKPLATRSIIRRALRIAHAINLQDMSKTIGSHAELVWFRLHYSDRHISAMLSQPYNSSDNSFADENKLSGRAPLERLERSNAALLGRIIARNVTMQQRNTAPTSNHDFYDDYDETMSIDYQLRQLAKSVPPRWWVPPTLNTSTLDEDIMHNSAVLHAQSQHFYALVLLHQPYLLKGHCSYSAASRAATAQSCSVNFDYNKLAALWASREMLSRFLVLRGFHNVPAYRGMDHKAFYSAVTLLLVHMDGHRLGPANALELHLSQDLGIVYSVIDLYKQDGTWGKGFADTLQLLLDAEADAANGSAYHITCHNDTTHDTGSIRLNIPYFGTLFVVKMNHNIINHDGNCLDSSPGHSQDCTTCPDKAAPECSDAQDPVITMPEAEVSNDSIPTLDFLR